MSPLPKSVFLLLGALAAAGVSLAGGRESYNPSSAGVNEARPALAGAPPTAAVPQPAGGPRSRYRTLLRKLAAPDDRTAYGDFCDFGYWAGTRYRGQQDLPPGYWVYLAPDWYIFKEEGSGTPPPPAAGPRAWGPEQATGAPDTWPRSGDITTAWASNTPDGQREWLELTYATPVRPTAVLIYETYNPGAVDRVTAFNSDGKEFDLWTGSDPTPAGQEKGISVIPVHPEFELTRIRVYLDSPKVSGWNEIDAVGLLDDAGATHWAASATASSTYADRTTSGPVELLGPSAAPR